jgi:hypothetical protein
VYPSKLPESDATRRPGYLDREASRRRWANWGWLPRNGLGKIDRKSLSGMFIRRNPSAFRFAPNFRYQNAMQSFLADQSTADLASAAFILVFNPKRRTVFWLTFAAVIEARRRNVRMPQPILNFGDVGIVRKSIPVRSSSSLVVLRYRPHMAS